MTVERHKAKTEKLLSEGGKLKKGKQISGLKKTIKQYFVCLDNNYFILPII